MSDLERKLTQEGWALEFFQAVRLLENLHPGSSPVGGWGPARDEAVSLRPSRGLGFPPGDLQSIERLTEGHREHWRITQHFMGLYGVSSPLPSFIPEMIAQAYGDQDPLRDFLDLFNHRALSLYYRSWKKYHLAATVDPTGPDQLTQALCAAIGGAGDTPGQGWTVAPVRLVRYAALLMGKPRPAGGLEAILADYFGVGRVRVHEFLPRKVKLGPAELSRLGRRQHRLGRELILGDKVLDTVGQFRLSMGPLDRADFLRLLPGQPAFDELIFLVRLYTRDRLDFQLELILEADQVEPLRLGGSGMPLGRYSWLGRPLGPHVSARLWPPDPS